MERTGACRVAHGRGRCSARRHAVGPQGTNRGAAAEGERARRRAEKNCADQRGHRRRNPGLIHASRLEHLDQARRVCQVRRRIQQHYPRHRRRTKPANRRQRDSGRTHRDSGGPQARSTHPSRPADAAKSCDEHAYAETVEFGGPVGEIFIRQAQVRWTQPFAAGEWSASMENPESLFAVSGAPLTAGSATPLRSDRDRYPDIIGRLKLKNQLGTFNAALIARNIRIDSATAADAKWGEGVSLTEVIPIGNTDDFRANFNVGNAIGRYQLSGFFPDGYVDATGKVRLAQAKSAYAAYRHFWSPMLRSSLILSASGTDTPGGGTFNGFNKSARSAHANLILSPVPRVTLGMELIYEKRTVVDGDFGTLHRVQFAAQFLF